MPSEPGGSGIFATLREIEERSGKAEEIARSVGEVVGRVSPYTESQTGTGGSEIRVLVEVDEYIRRKTLLAQPGAILAAVDLATLDVVSLKVVGVSRVDLYSMVGAREALTPYPIAHDPRGLLAKPQLLVEPLLAFRFDNGKLLEGRAATYAIEPRSPVVLPKPEYLETLVGMRGEVVLGAYTIGEEPVMLEGRVARALLPFDDLFYHTFVVGTTGSGKTTFIKNLIKSLLNLNKGVAVVCIDENGDYVQTIFDPRWELESEGAERLEREIASQLYGGVGGLKEITVLLPVTKHLAKGVADVKKLAEKYYKDYLKKLHMQACPEAECNVKVEEEKVFKVEGEKAKEVTIPVLSLTILNEQNGAKEIRKVRIIPYALNYNILKERIAELYPYFTARAKEAFPNIFRIFSNNNEMEKLISRIKQQRGRSPKLSLATSLEELVHNLDEIDRVGGLEELANFAKMFKQTLINLINGLSNLNQMGIFDVRIGERVIREPDVEMFIRSDSLTVLDLRPLSMLEEPLTKGAKRILTLRLLNRILGWKMEKEFEKTPPTIVLVDEAHRFFPRAAGTEEERDYVEYVSGALERVARLGRVRGLGLILSTHSPKDVHSVVLNLCNNKVVFRLEPSLAEELGLPRELRDLVSRASDRVGVVTSHALRLHHATFKTPPPVLGHFKVRG
jgi:DNA helicase HerA-like ATPase